MAFDSNRIDDTALRFKTPYVDRVDTMSWTHPTALRISCTKPLYWKTSESINKISHPLFIRSREGVSLVYYVIPQRGYPLLWRQPMDRLGLGLEVIFKGFLVPPPFCLPAPPVTSSWRRFSNFYWWPFWIYQKGGAIQLIWYLSYYTNHGMLMLPKMHFHNPFPKLLRSFPSIALHIATAHNFTHDPRWSGDVMKRPGPKILTLPHNRARPEVLFSNLKHGR